jgi:hypothetical protein
MIELVLGLAILHGVLAVLMLITKVFSITSFDALIFIFLCVYALIAVKAFIIDCTTEEYPLEHRTRDALKEYRAAIKMTNER